MLLEYTIISLIAFLGLYCGLLVGYSAREELIPGREHLNRLLHFLFAAIVVVFLYLNKSIIFFIAIPALIILFSFSKVKETLYYYTLAVILGLSYLYNGFLTMSTLIFLYGFPLGSLHLADRQKMTLVLSAKDLAKAHGGFIIIQVAFIIMYLATT
jgi:hypothetical protein